MASFLESSQICNFKSKESLYRENNCSTKERYSFFLSKCDTFACVPTGYGKSLQLAVRYAAKLSSQYKDRFSSSPLILVVSPLNSLITDQIASCEKLGIKAVKIDGAKTGLPWSRFT